ncbi:hypothetical protein [Umezawaea tangerina]|uniref:Uncharacterized protein n=1 Tax=Umezawaea tangerina TaxID=84725 RepID=A0A2T0TFW4_9PSEU|nr:hypothetical protein [Umezawaea tangerina]PRY44567.1 hypothetical protein CLV43_102132 [Umezawaea tangerina]
MNDQKLVEALATLADTSRTPDVDVDVVIHKSRTRARRRTAVVATALGTTVVLGGLLAFGGPLAGSSPPAPDAATTDAATSSAATSDPAAPDGSASGRVRPYPQLPKGPVPVPNADARPKLPVFADVLKAKVPVVVPGAVTHEQTFGIPVPRWDLTTNFTIVGDAVNGELLVRVFGKSAARVVRQLPPGECTLVEPAAVEPDHGTGALCYRQADGSYVRVDEESDGSMALPDPLVVASRTNDDRSGTGSSFQQRHRVAKHYRADGTVVEVWGSSGVDGAPPTVFTDQQLVTLATDPAFVI